MPDDNKEYLLNVIQAWVNLKIRVASFVLIANGAVLGTAFAFIKDKATELDEGFFPIRLAALGILFGGSRVVDSLLIFQHISDCSIRRSSKAR